MENEDRYAIIVIDRVTGLSRTALIMKDADEAHAKAARDTNDTHRVLAVGL